MSWRLAKSLGTLRTQINQMAPDRSRKSDGTVASAAHTKQNPTSDHEPDKPPKGVVCALDITHDPKGGLDAGTLAEKLRAAKDRRIKYVIYNRQIFGWYDRPHRRPWEWGEYRGSNPHTKHIHISVRPESEYYDNGAAWPGFPEAVQEKKKRRKVLMKRGDKGKGVTHLQYALLKISPGCLPKYGLDGVYGRETWEAVKAFQKTVDLDQTGNIDDKTGWHLMLALFNLDKE